MAWQDDARSDFAGEFVKFRPGESKILTILREPKKRTFVPEGEKKKVMSYNFDVLVYKVNKDDQIKRLLAGTMDILDLEYESKVWSVTSKRLIDLILEEDSIESIIRATFMIKALGDGFERQWVIKRLHGVVQKELGEEPDLVIQEGVSKVYKEIPDDEPEDVKLGIWTKQVKEVQEAEPPQKKSTTKKRGDTDESLKASET